MNPKKRIFLFYCAFAPFVAMAFCCHLSAFLGIVDDDAFSSLLFWTVLFTMPLSAWLAANAGSLALGCVVVELATLSLGTSYMPIAFRPITVMPVMGMSGVVLLLILDTYRPKAREQMPKVLSEEPLRCVDYARLGLPLESGVFPDTGIGFPEDES